MATCPIYNIYATIAGQISGASLVDKCRTKGLAGQQRKLVSLEEPAADSGVQEMLSIGNGEYGTESNGVWRESFKFDLVECNRALIAGLVAARVWCPADGVRPIHAR